MTDDIRLWMLIDDWLKNNQLMYSGWGVEEEWDTQYIMHCDHTRYDRTKYAGLKLKFKIYQTKVSDVYSDLELDAYDPNFFGQLGAKIIEFEGRSISLIHIIDTTDYYNDLINKITYGRVAKW